MASHLQVSSHLGILFQSCREFPKTPFLSIPKSERDARIAALPKKPFPFQANLSTLIRTRDADFSQAKTLKYPTYPGEGDIAAFYINWHIPLPELRKQFRQWLEENKPADACLRAKEGAGAPPRQMRAKLKALGALRVLRILRTQEAAYAYTTEILSDHMKVKHELFCDETTAWQRARRDAEKAIQKEGRFIEMLCQTFTQSG